LVKFRHGLVSVVLLLHIACAGQAPPPADTPKASESTPAPAPSSSNGNDSVAPAPSSAPSPLPSAEDRRAFAEKLAAARSLRDAALALGMPKYKGDRSKASHVAFVQGPVRIWYEKAKTSVVKARDAYFDAFSMGVGADRATAASEAADLQATFCKRFVDAGSQGEPDDWKARPDIHDTFHESLRQAVEPFAKEVDGMINRCLEDSSVDTPATRRCVALRAEIAPFKNAPIAPGR
jgi:hypothetical protein